MKNQADSQSKASKPANNVPQMPAHLPLNMHQPVIDKLCTLLEKNGVLIYTFGNTTGEHTDRWHEDEFYYSSIGINGNLTALINNGLAVMHLELDQFPEKHVYVVAQKS